MPSRCSRTASPSSAFKRPLTDHLIGDRNITGTRIPNFRRHEAQCRPLSRPPQGLATVSRRGVIPEHWPRRAQLRRGASPCRRCGCDRRAGGPAACVVNKELPERHEWEDDEDGWAAELYFESPFWANESFVRAFLVTVVDNAPDEVLGWVGAGPLEDFLGEGDEDRLLWLEKHAEESERLRQALRSVGEWRSAGWVPGPEPGTLVQERLDDHPAVDAIIRRIQSRL